MENRIELEKQIRAEIIRAYDAVVFAPEWSATKAYARYCRAVDRAREAGVLGE